MESVKSVIANILSGLTGTIVEHVGYPFQVDNKIRNLEEVTRNLVATKEDVMIAIENAKRENRIPTKQVVEWLRKAEIFEKEAEKIQENNRKRHRSVWSDYTISKKVTKKLCEGNHLFDQKTNIEVTMPLAHSLAQEMPASSSKSCSLNSTLHFIKDDVHGIIGIWGMGGVGKTHLLKQIHNELCTDGAFNVVVFITCSKECSEENIQDEIISKLNLRKSGNMEQKNLTIYNFLNQRSFVLLLDDLWNCVDIETIGIPDPSGIVSRHKRKVVLTTRSTEVCGQMEVRKKIRLDVLKWDDAWSLFKNKVTDETINSDPLIQRCAVNVAKELGGLPLALITIGRAMHDKIDPNEWEHTLEQLKNARLYDVELSTPNKSVFQTLKLSYDSLKTDTLRQCFLHCSLWPEGHGIHKRHLIELWMGLGLIDEPNIHVAYSVGYSNIRRLQAVCLLETVDDDSLKVKMHDVIRDMALWIANNQENENNKWIVQTSTFKKSTVIEVSCNTEKVSQMYYRKGEAFLSPRSSYTKLSVLMLNNNGLCNSKSLQLETFSELAVLNLSWNNFEVFPVEICKLVKLQFLNLSNNAKLESLPKEFGGLINLKYLFLRGAEYCTFPKCVLYKLKALMVLDLSYTYYVERGTRDDLRSFTSLEEELQYLAHFQALGISITNMNDFQMLSQTSIAPIRELEIRILEEKEKYISFANSFLGNSQLQNNLVSLALRGVPVELVKFEKRSHEQSICHLERLENLSFSMMVNMKQVVWTSLSPENVFSRLQVLHFGYCHCLTNISWIVRLPCIRVLQIKWCRSMKKMISIDELNNDGIIGHGSFSFLKEMYLLDNIELDSISDSIISFPALEILDVISCDKLKKLPFRTVNPPKKLRLVGTEKWWKSIEMDDITHRSSIQPFFRKI